MTKLLITGEEISVLSNFDGNIDEDAINPFIFMAQNSELKRILTDELYTKILEDNLTGIYADIYNNFAVYLLAYYSCFYYLNLGTFKVSQNGAYNVTPEKTAQLEITELDKKALFYKELAIGIEIKLIEFLEANTSTIPEYKSGVKSKSIFNWIKVK